MEGTKAMMLDNFNMFADAVAVTVSAQVGDVIDLGVDRDIGVGDPLELFLAVDTLFTADGAGTLTIALQTDNDEAFGTPTTLFTTAAIGKATLVAGYELAKIKVPMTTERYLRIYATVATGPMTAGKLTAGLILDRQANRHYPSGLRMTGF